MLERDQTGVARAKRQREMKTCIFAVGWIDATVMIRCSQVARQEPRRRGHKLDQIVDRLVSAGSLLARLVELHVIDHQTLLRRCGHNVCRGKPSAVSRSQEAVRTCAHTFLQLEQAELQILLCHHARRARKRPRGALLPVELHSVMDPRHDLPGSSHLSPKASGSAQARGVEDSNWRGD